MIQQVNLYQGGARDSFPLKNIYFLSLLAACLLLIAISGLNEYQLQQKQTQHQQLALELQNKTTHLQQLQAKFPKQAVDNSLSEQLQTSQQLYQSLSQIVELLSDDQSDQAKGYSQFFTALAEHTNRDVWLTRINIDSTTQDIRLHGSTFKSDQIPALLLSLQASKAFKGRHFARLTIQENPDNAALTDFNVSSSLKPNSKTENANQ